MKTAVTIAALLLALPACAQAATVSVVTSGDERVPDHVLTFDAAPGERNDVTTGYSAATGTTVADAGTVLAAGAGCYSLSEHEVACPNSSSATFNLGDGDDRITADGTIYGGPGDDVITATRGNYLYGDAGSDTIIGSSEDDTIQGDDKTPYTDHISGGGGTDLVSYAARTTPVVVDLGRGTGGAPGEADTLDGIENGMGGKGRDVLIGDNGPNSLIGYDVRGGGGDDHLTGVVANGGPGNDLIDPVGRARAACGVGDDIVRQLGSPSPTAFLQPDCELWDMYNGFDRDAYVRVQPTRVRNSLAFRFQCPDAEGGPGVCDGQLWVQSTKGSRKTLGHAHFRVRTLHSRSVRVPIARGSMPRAGTAVRVKLSVQDTGDLFDSPRTGAYITPLPR